MESVNFKKQIEEDFRDYRVNYGDSIKNINKDSWAFNFWILDKLFNVDEEIIESRIVDYKDFGIDCFEICEETGDIYLIQNKYYNDTSKINICYVKDDFLLRPKAVLDLNNYKKAPELQAAYNRMKDNPNFCLHLHIYITNNDRSSSIDNYIKEFNSKDSKCLAKIFYLDDIKEAYFGETFKEKKNFSYKLKTINHGTVLKIYPTDYKLNLKIAANYVFTPIVSIYRMYKEAQEKNYPIFDMNIREYLGRTGVNKKIFETLYDKAERNNFIYYNNGITMICDYNSKVQTTPDGAEIEVKNPQIVNGCQTVNSISEALDNMNKDTLDEEFKDTFVMTKVLVIDENNKEEEELYKNIVRYTNCQNSMDEKNFTANSSEFKRIQQDFENKGYLLIVKQSDKHKFEEKYSSISELSKKNKLRRERFGLPEIKKAKDCFIQLDKLLQVCLAFKQGGAEAYTKKNTVLKANSTQFSIVTEFCKSITTDNLLDLYLLFYVAELEKKNSGDAKTPIPFYLIDGFARFECESNAFSISDQLSDSSKVKNIIELYKFVSTLYTKHFKDNDNTENSSGYNTMIKRKIDYKVFTEQRDTAKILLEQKI